MDETHSALFINEVHYTNIYTLFVKKNTIKEKSNNINNNA